MNADNFASFLVDPSRLYQLNYYELKSLVLQYPYCANLHQLLLEKSIMEDHPDAAKNLVRASVTSIDRPALRRQVFRLRAQFQPLDTLNLESREEVLELRELSSLPASASAPPPADAQPSRPAPVAPEPEPPEAGPEESPARENELPSSEAAPPTARREEAPAEKPEREGSEKPKPNPKSSFTSWVKQFQPAHIKVQLGEIMESEKRPSPRSARKKYLDSQSVRRVEEIAQQSITPSEETVSETLASLLEKQGLYEEAAAMYEKLKLKFPEKSSFFAAKIDAIKRM
jgi:hypothetical protein